MLSGVCVVLLTLLRTQVSIAQTIRGIVVAPDSVTPVVGVIVMANDDHGNIVARVLSDERGHDAWC